MIWRRIKRYNELKPTDDNSPDESCDYMMIRTSLCWTETCSRSLKITESHKASGISVSSFIKFGKPHTSVSDFVSIAMSSMSIAASKSSLQSDIGAINIAEPYVTSYRFIQDDNSNNPM